MTPNSLIATVFSIALIIAAAGLFLLRSRLQAAFARTRSESFEAGVSQATHDAEIELTRQRGELHHLSMECDRLGGDLTSLNHQHAILQGQLLELSKTCGEHESANQSLRSELARERSNTADVVQQLHSVQTECRELAEALATANAQLQSETQRADSQLKHLAAAREELGNQFQVLANRILEEKAERVSLQNQESLKPLLQPLQERLKDFQQQVVTVYHNESRERQNLKEEIARLAQLNTQISTDAVNLTQALKGSNKTQGIWGEMVLENVLEASGLAKGRDYVVQGTFVGEDGQQLRPDVVINLPEGKHMIVDSKMSLLAYEQFCSAGDESHRQAAVKDHLQSLRAHVKGLSSKNYQHLSSLNAPDFVLMFIPIEPAFMLAVTNENSLFNEALARNVLIVSPSTLLATLRIIANIWRLENQNRNAQEIADQCGRLYDKFVGFVEDMESIGTRLNQAKDVYESAHKKLVSGRGALVTQANKVRQMGVKTSKSLQGGFEGLAA